MHMHDFILVVKKSLLTKYNENDHDFPDCLMSNYPSENKVN